ncbi:hypothetical protein THIOM_003759 [Candidatus Thiomargarita nelsonii]|uniref:Uncharacterized protein n=1 Tax=Candidatus Thiomargarita nelsonii TaxID=1003181 RepID=A0A176RXM4_9GAMM|nr:hypothetical protein THIOM_003759 [Candidatus Thiomargarita nelsonii]
MTLLLESKALALDEPAACPKLKLWTPSDLTFVLKKVICQQGGDENETRKMVSRLKKTCNITDATIR